MKIIYKTILLLFFICYVNFGQETYLINSLADDLYSHPWDDSTTIEDEREDGICKDELGRCTLRAAVEEASNRNATAKFIFSVSGTINLVDYIELEDFCEIDGNNQIELSGIHAAINAQNNTKINRLRLSSNLYAGVVLEGNFNTVGGPDDQNEFVNCQVGVLIQGDNNAVFSNSFGITFSGSSMPNRYGIVVEGNYNDIGAPGSFNNVICNSVISGVSLSFGHGNKVQGNYIGTTSTGRTGVGNAQGITIGASDNNIIGGNSSNGNVISGNSVSGIAISGEPPDSYSDNNLISYNVIGLNNPQDNSVPNGNGIVLTNGVRNCTINNNIIAGNSLSGIHIFAQDDETKTSGHNIFDNKIGINYNGINFPNGQNGINIWGNVENVAIGTDVTGSQLPNIIVGNQGYGIYIADQFGYYPSKITARKNLIYQNNSANLFVSPLSNDGILPPYSLTFSNNNVAGIHDIPGAIIDVYKANINEFSPSAYEWLGSTTVGSNGVFAYEITDPSIEAVSLTATTNVGNTSGFGFIELITDVEKEDDNIPTEFALNQNYPNPFNPSTTITFSIPDEEFISLKVFNSLGEEVAELVNETKPAGNYSVSFDASELTSGIYFYKLNAGNFFQTRKMMLVK